MMGNCFSSHVFVHGSLDPIGSLVFASSPMYPTQTAVHVTAVASGRIIRKFSGGPHGERGARAYNGGLGAVPRPGAVPLVRGLGGEAPLKLKAFYSSAAPN